MLSLADTFVNTKIVVSRGRRPRVERPEVGFKHSMADAARPLETALATESREVRFAAFVDAHQASARRLAWRLVGGDAGAADDVAQEAFIRAWRALPRFRGDARLETWFHRILLNTASSHRRRRAVQRVLAERWATEAERAAPPASQEPALRERIGAALEGLTRRQREAFVLVHLEGLSVRQTADILGKPLGTVKSHLQRALVALRRELGDLREHPET